VLKHGNLRALSKKRNRVRRERGDWERETSITSEEECSEAGDYFRRRLCVSKFKTQYAGGGERRRERDCQGGIDPHTRIGLRNTTWGGFVGGT